MGLTNAMLDTTAIKVWRACFALVSAGVLIITFYFPLIGLGYALDTSADFESRAAGVLYVLPSVAALLLIVGMLPRVRGGTLLLLGIAANMLLLAPVIGCVRMGFPAAFGVLVAIAYAGAWWLLVKTKLN